jgi:hypothetical protein
MFLNPSWLARSYRMLLNMDKNDATEARNAKVYKAVVVIGVICTSETLLIRPHIYAYDCIYDGVRIVIFDCLSKIRVNDIRKSEVTGLN